MNDAAVVDASALVELLLGTEHGSRVSAAFSRFAALHAPAHLDAEVLSALGRLHRAGRLKASEVSRRLEMLSEAPIERHPLASLVTGAWSRRDRLRLVDALYVELSDRLGAAMLTTDARLATAAGIEAISV